MHSAVGRARASMAISIVRAILARIIDGFLSARDGAVQ